MIEYARKFKATRDSEQIWHTTFLSHTITESDWKLFDFKIDGVIFNSPTEEFQNVYGKLRMWSKLND